MRVIQERNAANTPAVVYTRGHDLSGSLEGAGGIGGLLGRSHGWYSGGTYLTHNHYHADGNGNITYLVNVSQALAASYRYDPYGRLMGQAGTLATANLYRFSAKELHPQSGMYYYGFRFYEPHLQRWVNRDPIEEAGDLNLFAFAMNDPGNLQDADGRAVHIPILGGVALCLRIPACAQVLANAARGAAIGGAVTAAWIWDMCRPDPRKEPENCPLEDQKDMGPLAGYRCEYWCRKSGAKPVFFVPHSERGLS
jgi:RHS repeat-associated protein